jgi:hypothetical protein
MALDRPASARSSVVLGLALVLIGGLALLGQALRIDLLGLGWPLFVLVPGIILFVIGLAVGGTGGLGLAIPGGIVSMVGLVLTFQAATGLWSTWAYAWALVAPGGVGLALVLYGLLTRQPGIVRNGLPVLLAGLGLFAVFALLFEGVFRLNELPIPLLGDLVPIGLLVLGVVIVVYGATRRREA